MIGTLKDASEVIMELTPDRRRTILHVQRRDRMSFLAIDLETSKVSNLVEERIGCGNFQNLSRTRATCCST